MSDNNRSAQTTTGSSNDNNFTLLGQIWARGVDGRVHVTIILFSECCAFDLAVGVKFGLRHGELDHKEILQVFGRL